MGTCLNCLSDFILMCMEIFFFFLIRNKKTISKSFFFFFFFFQNMNKQSLQQSQ